MEKLLDIIFFWLTGLMKVLKTQPWQSFFEGPKGNNFKTYFYTNYPSIFNFQPNLNHSIWIANEKVITKTMTRCLVCRSGTKLVQSIVRGLNDYIFKTYFYCIFSYEYSLQGNLNHSILISYQRFMTKILTVYCKYAL